MCYFQWLFFHFLDYIDVFGDDMDKDPYNSHLSTPIENTFSVKQSSTIDFSTDEYQAGYV